MAICSNCNQVIDYLNYTITSTAGGSFSLDKGFEEDYDGNGNEVTTYKCPECDEELFYDDIKASKFLEEKDELKELVATKVNEEEAKEREERATKREVIDTLKGDRKIVCPFCQHDRFLRKETCWCDVWEREGNGTCDEDISGETYEYFCTKCNKKMEDLN